MHLSFQNEPCLQPKKKKIELTWSREGWTEVVRLEEWKVAVVPGLPVHTINTVKASLLTTAFSSWRLSPCVLPRSWRTGYMCIFLHPNEGSASHWHTCITPVNQTNSTPVNQTNSTPVKQANITPVNQINIITLVKPTASHLSIKPTAHLSIKPTTHLSIKPTASHLSIKLTASHLSIKPTTHLSIKPTASHLSIKPTSSHLSNQQHHTCQSNQQHTCQSNQQHHACCLFALAHQAQIWKKKYSLLQGYLKKIKMKT